MLSWCGHFHMPLQVKPIRLRFSLPSKFQSSLLVATADFNSHHPLLPHTNIIHHDPFSLLGINNSQGSPLICNKPTISSLMENSNESSVNKALSSEEHGYDGGEESGWTMYFEDFLRSQKRESSSCRSSSIGEGSSVVSDAASCAALKPSASLGAPKSCKKLSFKKRRARVGLDDDSLEDTASSPVNSPKVGDFDLLDMNTRRNNDNRGISQERKIVAQNSAEMGRGEIDGLGYIIRPNDCSELEKRGICLVPLSMLADYLG